MINKLPFLGNKKFIIVLPLFPLDLRIPFLSSFRRTFGEEEDLDHQGVPSGFKEKLSELQQIFPCVEIVTKQIPKDRMNSGRAKPIITIQVSFSHSWHQVPEKEGEEGISNWIENKSRFPSPQLYYSKFILPNDALLFGVPLNIQPTKAKLFLSGPSLAKSGKVELRGPAFLPGTVNIGSDNKVVSIEHLLRHSLKEQHASEFLMGELLERIKDTLENENQVKSFKEELRWCFKMLFMIERCVVRATSFSTSAHVSSKLMLRNQVLDKLWGDESTKEQLRYSQFSTPSLFGDLSAEFSPNLRPDSSTFYKYVLSTTKPESNLASFAWGKDPYKRSSKTSWISSAPKVAKTTQKTFVPAPVAPAAKDPKAAGPSVKRVFPEARGGRGRGGRGSKRGRY